MQLGELEETDSLSLAQRDNFKPGGAETQSQVENKPQTQPDWLVPDSCLPDRSPGAHGPAEGKLCSSPGTATFVSLFLSCTICSTFNEKLIRDTKREEKNQFKMTKESTEPLFLVSSLVPWFSTCAHIRITWRQLGHSLKL